MTDDDRNPSRVEPLARTMATLVAEFGLTSLTISVFSMEASMAGPEAAAPGLVKVVAGVPFGGKVLAVAGAAQSVQGAVDSFRREVAALRDGVQRGVEKLSSV